MRKIIFAAVISACFLTGLSAAPSKKAETQEQTPQEQNPQEQTADESSIIITDNSLTVNDDREIGEYARILSLSGSIIIEVSHEMEHVNLQFSEFIIPYAVKTTELNSKAVAKAIRFVYSPSLSKSLRESSKRTSFIGFVEYKEFDNIISALEMMKKMNDKIDKKDDDTKIIYTSPFKSGIDIILMHYKNRTKNLLLLKFDGKVMETDSKQVDKLIKLFEDAKTMLSK